MRGIDIVKEIIFCIGVLGIRIADNHLCTSLMHIINKSRKLYLFFIVKQVFQYMR